MVAVQGVTSTHSKRDNERAIINTVAVQSNWLNNTAQNIWRGAHVVEIAGSNPVTAANLNQ